MNTEATEQAPKKKRGCGFWILVVLGVFVGLAVLGSLLPKPTPEEQAALAAQQLKDEQEAAQQEQAEAEAERASAMKVTASELFGAYQANEMAAQKAFEGQLLEVSGTVDGVELDFSDDPVVKLKTQNQFMPVSVYLTDSTKDQAAELRKGQKVTLLCREISEVISMPQLKECTLAP